MYKSRHLHYKAALSGKLAKLLFKEKKKTVSTANNLKTCGHTRILGIGLEQEKMSFCLDWSYNSLLWRFMRGNIIKKRLSFEFDVSVSS